MRTITLCGMALAMWASLVTVWAERDEAGPPLRLELTLSDGSRVIGTPEVEAVPVETPYAKMAIPLRQISAIVIGDDRETASLDLRNGDNVKGVVALKSVRLDTLFGRVTIGAEHLRRLRVFQAIGSLPVALQDGLTLYYSFDRDEAGRVSDASGQGHDGRVSGARWVPDGIQGGAYAFAGGEQHISTGRVPIHTMAVADDRTFALWWKATGSLQHKTLLNQLDGQGQGFAIMVLPEGYYVPSIVHQFGKFATPFADGQWHHAVLVKKGTSWRMFHDGREQSLSDSRNWPVGQDLVCVTGIQIGNTPGSQGTGFEGVIDEVMVYNRALSDEEVRQIHAIQKP